MQSSACSGIYAASTSVYSQSPTARIPAGVRTTKGQSSGGRGEKEREGKTKETSEGVYASHTSLVTRTSRNGGKPRCSIARLTTNHPVLRESCIVAGKGGRQKERERETIGPVSLRPTMAFPDLLSGTRGRVKGHVKGYITACIPPTAKLNALNPSTQIGERVYVEDIARAKTTLIFKMCYPSAGHSGLSKEPAGDPPPDTRLNICECGRV